MMQSITNDVHHATGGATFTYQSGRSTNCRNLSGGTCTTASVSLVSGDLAVATCWSWAGSGTITQTITDSGGVNVWHQIDSNNFNGGGAGLMKDFYTVVASTASVTISCTTTQSGGVAFNYADLIVDSWTSTTGWPSVPLDQHNPNSFLGTAPCSNTTGSTTQATELLYGACTGSGSAGPTVGAPLTQAQLFDGNSCITAYRSLSATGTYTFSVTDSNANPEASVVATFKPN